MKTYKLLAMALIIFGLLAVFQSTAVYGSPIPGQAIMKMTQYGKPDDVLSGSGARVRDSIPGSQTYLIESGGEADWDTFLGELESDSNVIFVESNYSVNLPETFQMSISFPDDNAPPLLKGVEPSDFFEQPSIYAVGIDSAQTIATGEGITVAIIDNGVDLAHPFLTSNILSTGYDFISDDNYPGYEAGLFAGHGTFVSGLTVLVAPDCNILPLRAFDSEGIGNTYAIAEAVYYAIDQDVDIINMSFGSTESSQILIQASNKAILNGITMVAASGNNSHDIPVYPSALPGVIAVSGINAQDILASFSNYGDYIDICAPSIDLYSTLAGDADWGTWSGTSFSAPIVSATCAMVKESNPDYSTFLMHEHIRQTASTEFLWGTLTPPDPFYGYGRINVYNAVSQIEELQMPEYGDLDGDGMVNVNDVVRLVKYIYGQGPAPVSPGNPDANCDGVVDEYDIEYYINRIYHHGPRCGRCN